MTVDLSACDGWRGRVWLDGEEIGTRCRTVRFEGEVPVAVEVTQGRIVDGEFVWEWRSGIVRVEQARLRR